MSNSFVKLSAMALLVCGLGMVTACGDEAETNNTANNTNNTNNVNECPAGQVKATVEGTESCRKDCATDATVCGATEMCAAAGDKKVCVAKPAAECETGKIKVGAACVVDCSANANVCQATEECKTEGENKVCRVKTVVVPDKTAPKCSDANPPARCALDAATFVEWAPASIINSLVLEAECCFDFSGDGAPDNALAGLVDLVPDTSLADINVTIKDSIDSGSIALVLEHDGVKLDADGEFSVQFLLGKAVGDPKPVVTGGNEYKINPASFEMGAYGQAVALATKTGSKIAAGPGSIVLNIELLGIALALKVSDVQITADIDAANTSAAAGVALKDGKLGGLIRGEDLVGAINTFSDANCGCLTGLGEAPNKKSLLNFAITDGMAEISCTEGVQALDCDKDDQTEGICKTVAENCAILSVASAVFDVDSKAVGKDCASPALGLACDSISIGAKFTAVGAKVTGLVEAAPGE